MSSSSHFTFEDRTDRLSRNAGKDYHHTLCNITDERKSDIRCAGSPKSPSYVASVLRTLRRTAGAVRNGTGWLAGWPTTGPLVSRKTVRSRCFREPEWCRQASGECDTHDSPSGAAASPYRHGQTWRVADLQADPIIERAR